MPETVASFEGTTTLVLGGWAPAPCTSNTLTDAAKANTAAAAVKTLDDLMSQPTFGMSQPTFGSGLKMKG